MPRVASFTFVLSLLVVLVAVPLASAEESAGEQPAKSSLASKAMTDHEMDEITAGVGCADNFCLILPTGTNLPSVDRCFRGNCLEMGGNRIDVSSPFAGRRLFVCNLSNPASPHCP